MQSNIKSFLSSKSDILGIAASTLCAIHCLATPVAITLLPGYMGEFWESAEVHYLFAVFVVLFGISAMIPGYRRHRDNRIMALMSLGLGLIVFATVFPNPEIREIIELPVLLTGGMLLISGHLLNYRCCLKCVNG